MRRALSCSRGPASENRTPCVSSRPNALRSTSQVAPAAISFSHRLVERGAIIVGDGDDVALAPFPCQAIVYIARSAPRSQVDETNGLLSLRDIAQALLADVGCKRHHPTRYVGGDTLRLPVSARRRLARNGTPCGIVVSAFGGGDGDAPFIPLSSQ